MTIPTTQQAVDAAVAALESGLSQTVPTYDKSFLRVLSVILGMNNAELYRYGEQRLKQVLALTARGDDLTQLGIEYGVIRKPETKTVLEVVVGLNQVTAGTIAKTDSMLSSANNLYYFPVNDYAYGAGDLSVTINVRCESSGVIGDLSVNSKLFFSDVIIPRQDFGVVTAIVQLGSDEETDDELRVRILDEIQTVGGGSNAADYRTWGQRCPNVYRIDPYTGVDPWATSIPGWRTVYVESTSSYDPNGLADAALLDLVKQYILYDQDTGKRNVCLGSTDDSFVVASISRSISFIKIYDLEVEASSLLDCQSDITTAINDYIRAMRPFIQGLDREAFRNDTLTPVSVSREAQRVVQAYGGSMGTLTVQVGSSLTNSYRLDPGERLSVQVSFV